MAEHVYGMHHIGITVPDLDEGIAFFKSVFGAVAESGGAGLGV